jgi:hypothetical protein
VDPRAGLDDAEKRKFLTLPGLELRPLSRPARSQTLYRLRCPGAQPETICPEVFVILLFPSSMRALIFYTEAPLFVSRSCLQCERQSGPNETISCVTYSQARPHFSTSINLNSNTPNAGKPLIYGSLDVLQQNQGTVRT